MIGCGKHKLEIILDFYRHEEVLQASNPSFHFREDFSEISKELKT